LADLEVLARLIRPNGFVHGAKPTSIDAGIYGFIANIYFYDIQTPLKQCVFPQQLSQALRGHPCHGDSAVLKVLCAPRYDGVHRL
jgi:hypothetical protein